MSLNLDTAVSPSSTVQSQQQYWEDPVLEAGDKLLVMADDKTSINNVYSNLEIPGFEVS